MDATTQTKQSGLYNYVMGYSDPTPEAYQAYGKELLNSALWGAGVTGTGAALYHLVNGLRSARPAPKQKKPAPAAASETNDELPDETKTAGFLEDAHETIGKLIPKQLLPSGLLGQDDPNYVPSLNARHDAWRHAMNYGAIGLGGYGAYKLINSMANKKKKEDREDSVNQARQDYFNALTGKEAQVLDDAYSQFKKTAEEYAPNISKRVWDAATGAGQSLLRFFPEAATNWTLLTALGAGGLGAKYMYDRTKAMTQAEALRKAQESKTRLQSIQQTPWIDPEELAAVAGR